MIPLLVFAVYLLGVVATATGLGMFDAHEEDFIMAMSLLWPLSLFIVVPFGFAMLGMYLADRIRGKV